MPKRPRTEDARLPLVNLALNHGKAAAVTEDTAEEGTTVDATENDAALSPAPAKKARVLVSLGDGVAWLRAPSTSMPPHAGGPASAKSGASASVAAATAPGTMSTVIQIGGGTASTSAAEQGEAWRLHPALRRALAAMRIARFFPVQADVVPLVIRADAGADPTVGDVCISSPTGSGKTLAYALPVLQAVLREQEASGTLTAPSHRLLRALVVLPTRDLALQVLQVFQQLTAGTDVRVAAAVGQSSFEAESRLLRTTADDAGSLRAASGGVDVLICTPGRLVEHLDHTAGFTLRHLRHLVVDEADRLLSESYQEWVRRVHESAFGGPALMDAAAIDAGLARPQGADSFSDSSIHGHTGDRIGDEAGDSGGLVVLRKQLPSSSRVGHVVTPAVASAAAVSGGAGASRGLASPNWLHRGAAAHGSWSRGAVAISPLASPFRKIVCSATLTNNPQKLASLRLQYPLHFVAKQDVTGAMAAADGSAAKYQLPATLKQSYVVCGAGDKPIVLVHLLRLLDQVSATASSSSSSSGLRALVFTVSVEATHRLTRLLQLFGGLSGRVVEFSADLSQAQRTAVLQAARAGVVSVLVCSDAAARGLDLPSLPAVIHYDVPPRTKTYVHRVGRAARAGLPGISYALVKPEQARHFRQITERVAAAEAAQKETVTAAVINGYAARMQAALGQLKTTLEDERAGKLLPTQPVAVLSDGDSGPLPDVNSLQASAEAGLAPDRLAAAASALLEEPTS